MAVFLTHDRLINFFNSLNYTASHLFGRQHNKVDTK